MRKEYSGSAERLTLLSSITDSALSLNASTVPTAGWPDGASGNPFVITLDRGTASEEKVLVTSRTGSGFTLAERGYEGTTAKAHSAASGTIEHTIDATTFFDLWNESEQVTVGNAAPVSPLTDDLWLDTSGAGAAIYDGDFEFQGDVDLTGTVGGVAQANDDLLASDGTAITPKSFAELDLATVTASNAAYLQAHIVAAGGSVATALSAAAASSTVKKVHLLAGAHTTAAQLTLPTGVELIVGRGATLTASAAIATAMIVIANGADNCAITGDGLIDVNNNSATGILSASGSTATNVLIDVAIANATTRAVDFDHGVTDAIVNVRCSGTPYGVRVQGDCLRVDVVEGDYADIATYGVEFRATATKAPTDCSAVDNKFHDFDQTGTAKQGVVAYGRVGNDETEFDSAYTTNLTVHNNTCVGPALEFASGSGGTGDQFVAHYVKNLTFTDNKSIDGGENGVSITRWVKGGTVANNLAVGNFGHGIQISRPVTICSGLVIEGNVAKNNGQDNAGGGSASLAGVYLQYANECVVVGNLSHDTQGTATQTRGFLLSNCSNMTYALNHSFGCTLDEELTGTNTFDLRDNFGVRRSTGYVGIGGSSTIATAGALRLESLGAIQSRNAAGSQNVALLRLTGSDKVTLSQSGYVTNILDELELEGAFNHDGTTIGLNGATPVAKDSGWAAATGTATKTTFVTSTVTTAQLAERVKALLDYLILRGDIGA